MECWGLLRLPWSNLSSEIIKAICVSCKISVMVVWKSGSSRVFSDADNIARVRW